MCLRPISIKNPTFARSSYVSEEGVCKQMPSHLTPSTEFIEVPCGKCADCRNTYYNSILQRAIIESKSSYMYFLTLTYDNSHLPSVILPTGEVVYYSDYNDIQNLFKRLRNKNVIGREFRYLCVNEFGDSNSRPHFHLLIFISKLDDDTRTTPFEIERLLFKEIPKYYALNVGTRKNPKYEPLFTYKLRYTINGVKTNFFVKYVEPTTQYSQDCDDNTTFVKTIRYLIGYINKGSSFDDTVRSLLDNLNDRVLSDKLSYLLRSRIRYSKGFGNGFDKGMKLDLKRISVKASSNTILFSDFVATWPSQFSEFVELYPQYVADFSTFVRIDKYKKHISLEEAINNMTSSDYISHCIFVKYFPRAFNVLYSRYYRVNPLSNPTISYLFNKCKPKYEKSRIYTDTVVKNPTYELLRKGVDEGISAGVPYLSFKTFDGYTGLCKYYRERVCTINDTINLYNMLNIANYEEWKNIFVKQLDLRKASKVNANKHIFENNDKIIWKTQKKCQSLSRELAGVDLYRSVLIDCKVKKR